MFILTSGGHRRLQDLLNDTPRIMKIALIPVHELASPLAILLDDGHHGVGLLARDCGEGVPLKP